MPEHFGARHAAYAVPRTAAPAPVAVALATGGSPAAQAPEGTI
ncbi:hypothetical protein [Streptomyces roseolilacinus]|uniref:Uncharacterized protein n=1 Tax=Streptomyces roseolilacinus TaxID=66904 RepID=A0A918ELN3_9ACTN|nr:hypothetical protein [Streptomyces roseolilacinus]GGQ09412.1 hypothetical protein GCM10010249_29960 [Streptomyces roseolilacinus]